MSINPYASPQSSIESNLNESCWREGKVLVMRVGTTLPARCVKCNGDAPMPRKTRQISWHHPGWYMLFFLNFLIYLVASLIVSKKQKISPALCRKHIQRRRVFIAIDWVGFILSMFALLAGIANHTDGLMALGGVGLLATAIVSVVNTRIVYPTRITADQIHLKGCGEDFLDSLDGQR